MSVRARTVVMALGFLPFARFPAGLAGLPSALVTHSSQVNDLAEYTGQEVAIIGAGQSAIETACLIKEAGGVPHLVVRAKSLEWNAVPRRDRASIARLFAPESGLGMGLRSWLWSERPGLVPHLPAAFRRRIVRTTLGPAGAWWLRERFEGVSVRRPPG